MNNVCHDCSTTIPNGEPFVKVVIVKELCRDKTLEPHDANWILSFCMECAGKKDFSSMLIPSAEKEFRCCLCGMVVPNGTLMWNITCEKVKMDGGVVVPDESDILRTYCEECGEKGSLLKTTILDVSH